ncbi:lipopolysaccharide kinase InaA family protein [Variovorax ginsengisoli]|uniref:Endogenous inhibitor of DNA gyrase (YacG/DUF329 family) n=1 Tax=Variovorax ginsengisoli TaxID=363844 RepID=A0ABT9S6R7_9BURK|nr:lipopolysaccharide kinase InaA family protein [Variovorax ginsengisoli]MDP9900053.1 endogenous inhibitor of DNA gyrase (YacG/DUF329 family) [Variovorax ginsengisoli]
MLTLTAVLCPQCAAPLPRAARWRTVQCAYCGATVMRGEERVERKDFRNAWLRAEAEAASGQAYRWRQANYLVKALVGKGPHCDVLLAERLGAVHERVTMKIARDAGHRDALAQELQVLSALQAIQAPGAAYYTRRLPQPVGAGRADGGAGDLRDALVLRHPAGYWGSLADVMQTQPRGIDPRHAVWIWRRMLEVLGFLHANGWSHGDIAPAHALVHPHDHGILLIGWRQARQGHAAAHAEAVARDLRQSAWTVRLLLQDTRAPAPLADLLHACSDDVQACMRLGATGIEAALSGAARAAFGAPQFVRFDPAPPGA